MATELPHIIPQWEGRTIIQLLTIYGRSDEGSKGKEQKLINFERACEKQLGDALELLGIRALVKVDRYSLPYQHELLHVLSGSHNLHEAYQFERFARVIVRHLIEMNILKLRFYLYINFVKAENDKHGSLEYRFRYFVHENDQ